MKQVSGNEIARPAQLILASTEVFVPGCSSFEKLRSVREMEYELDFVTNRANRDTKVTFTSSGFLRTATKLLQVGCLAQCKNLLACNAVRSMFILGIEYYSTLQTSGRV